LVENHAGPLLNGNISGAGSSRLGAPTLVQ
jgi:hypothetical protein